MATGNTVPATPVRLFAKAQQAKSAIFNIATKSQRDITQVPVPQGLSDNAFYETMDEHRAVPGKDMWSLQRS
ncbi:Vanillyl-alcohol oxidase [Penicillium canariense]|uniref:Vanillyl-alcohol oxidase n=1 Tax=Penicillium canariense TaxID=189055 RepID=A0A9W9HUY2_9EURO|nr:Vanillyl-alcohol oxidase [Penicillium canariense]KAJ5157158.1 Vanillyl-alcohol oxidase [Penicillium canariense]